MLSLIITGTQQIYDRLDDHDKITTQYHNKYHKKLQGQTPRHPKVFALRIVWVYLLELFWSTLLGYVKYYLFPFHTLLSIHRIGIHWQMKKGKKQDGTLEKLRN